MDSESLQDIIKSLEDLKMKQQQIEDSIKKVENEIAIARVNSRQRKNVVYIKKGGSDTASESPGGV